MDGNDNDGCVDSFELFYFAILAITIMDSVYVHYYIHVNYHTFIFTMVGNV